MREIVERPSQGQPLAFLGANLEYRSLERVPWKMRVAPVLGSYSTSQYPISTECWTAVILSAQDVITWAHLTRRRL